MIAVATAEEVTATVVQTLNKTHISFFQIIVVQ